MRKGKRLSILTEAEIEELYSPPVFSESDQRFFFALNDRELGVVNRIRDRKHRRASPVAWQSINLKGKYLFGQTGEAPDIEYLMASISEYVPLSEK